MIAEWVCLQLLATATARAAGTAAFPADLGATVVDVSGYPPEHRRVYETLIEGKCAVCHTPARALNAPYLELDAAEAEAFRREHPAEAADPAVIVVAPDAWKRYITRMWRRPPCCNACPRFSRAEGQAAWHFLVYDAKRRKTGAALASFVEQRRSLLVRFETKMEEHHANIRRVGSDARRDGLPRRD